jgi:hypothetical protein
LGNLGICSIFSITDFGISSIYKKNYENNTLNF